VRCFAILSLRGRQKGVPAAFLGQQRSRLPNDVIRRTDRTELGSWIERYLSPPRLPESPGRPAAIASFPVIDVLDPDDVILAEIAAGLNLDKLHVDLAWVGEAMS
jgi:hypothetical protein